MAPLVGLTVLAACNSTEVLDPSGNARPSGATATETALTSENPPPAQAGSLATQPVTAGQPPTQAAALSSPASIQLAPIVGSTVESITPLSRRLSARGAQRGIAFAGNGDATTSHILKGYFSTISDGGETTVIYVWDVLDAGGNRLHRIQGQEKVVGATAQGWAGVPAATMEAIADSTIEQFVQWLASRQG